MDFPQQIEVERPPSAYDVIMEPVYPLVERKASINKGGNKHEHSSIPADGDKMNSSVNSTFEDTTPSDSGVQMLDSESSEFMIESITSQVGFEFEDGKLATVGQELPNEVRAVAEVIDVEVDTNSNVTAPMVETMVSTGKGGVGGAGAGAGAGAGIGGEDAMTTSACSTFDATENIVYRRKVRKTTATPKAPKKRVSFHEDILKNTRTDNIHIEHGFITYKNGRKSIQPHAALAGRYSWCSEGDGGRSGAAGHTELCTHAHEDEEQIGGAGGRQKRCVVYRNACSDVLDYGNSDVFDTNESNRLQYDNSGIFEYTPEERVVSGGADEGNNAVGGVVDDVGEGQVLYRCSCSSSNSSLDSDENDKNSNRQQYGQAKSSSCDCIGMSNANNNIIGDNCYFSEPNIDNLNENAHKKSVWNKEKKPKSSCLKKTKYHTNIIQEQDLNTKMKKFNVHDMNQLLDNSSKMIIGSLKSIFTMPLPERGVPEGSEDLQSVAECVPESESTPEHKPKTSSTERTFTPSSPPLKPKPFLSKSLDGSKQQQGVKKFVHNVDEQLRRKNEAEIYAPTRQSSAEKAADPPQQSISNQQIQPNKSLQRQEEVTGDLEFANHTVKVAQLETGAIEKVEKFHNKFIVNCESTVFEHTGISYCYDGVGIAMDSVDVEESDDRSITSFASSLLEKDTPIAQAEPDQLHSAFISAPIAKTFSNFFRSLKESATSPTGSTVNKIATDSRRVSDERRPTQSLEGSLALKFPKTIESPAVLEVQRNLPTTQSSSTISDLTTSTASLPPPPSSTAASYQSKSLNTSVSNSLVIGQDLRGNLEKQSRHLPSPLKKRASSGNLMSQPQRYGASSVPDACLLNPDIFNVGAVGTTPGSAAMGYAGTRGGNGRDSKSTILSEEFDDILTITTDTDKNESDIVIVDYPEVSDKQSDYMSLLKPPPAPVAKTSLINRFLRNVTQKKILESSIRKNDFFAGKLRNEQKLLAGNLYVRGVKPKNYDLIDDLNAEIAMEIEMSGANSPRRELVSIDSDLPGDVSRFELGIGEISIEIFNGNYLHILRDPSEQLMKVFKLYTGYSREGFMTPVLVFLTDKTLYVTDLVRNRLCSKFMLAYADLDVILMGPFGNTVLLSNSARDMQQVLLAGGPYPADGLVANLELCARRSGSTLPAVGQLTLEHLAPLQTFVRENSSVGKEDTWMYYAVVNVPAGMLGCEQEPLGPHVKGFLMHRRIREPVGQTKQPWNPGYFLLKAGVLYMFHDSSQKLPSWAMALAECQGARRAVKAGRPHCFEILLKGELLQLAAPDEYVASEWLQALLQTASGLFEMQEKHKTLGCTLIVTQNHLITLREDFTAPLRQVCNNHVSKVTVDSIIAHRVEGEDLNNTTTTTDAGSVLSSAMSTPTKGTLRSCSSINSTPTKLSQISRSTTTGNTNSLTSTNTTTTTTTTTTNTCSKQQQHQHQVKSAPECYSNMCSVYGRNCGVEILTCADIKEMTGIKIPSHNDTWWCILEFSCQEVCESTDDLVIFFASSSEMQRFLRLLEQLWQAKNNDLFPITVLDEDDIVAEQCTVLYMDINRSWEPLLSAALGYPL